jgi:hypothetical protein
MNTLRFIFTTVLIFVANTWSFSQVNGTDKTPEERAAILTENMITNLSLDATQTEQVTQINLGVAQKNEAITNDTTMSQELKLACIQGNNDTRRAYFKLILTEDQYSKYLEMEESVKEIKKVKRNIKLEKESLKEGKED